MGKQILILALFIGLVSTFSNAQENKYSLWVTYYNSPSDLSFKVINRVDYSTESYEDADIKGYGAGFSVRLFEVFSPEVNLLVFNMSGRDGHLAGSNDEHVSFEGIQFRIGGALHLIRTNPGLDFQFGFIEGRSEMDSPTEIVDRRNQEGGIKGLYFGSSLAIQLNRHSTLKVGVNIVGFNLDSEESTTGSFSVSSVGGVGAEFSASYRFSF